MNPTTYLIGTERTTNAIDAWSSALGNRLRPSLDLGMDFSDFDWKIRPTESISVLEDLRTSQIQAKGLPIRIMYSGGTDSHSIAHAFARNKIPVRYTLVTWFTLKDDALDSNFWNEVKLRRLKALHESYNLPEPEVEIITIDKDKHDRYFASSQFLESSYYGCNLTFSLNHFPGVLEYSKWNPRTTVNVYGIEKPRLYKDNIGVFWQVTDTMSMYTYSNEFDTTWFYLSKDNLPLIASQVWAVYDYAKSMTLPLEDALHTLQTSRDLYFQWCQVLHRRTDLWFALMSKQSKVTKVMQSANDDTRYHHFQQYAELQNQAWRNYRSLLSKLNDLNIGKLITPILSPRYYITKVT